MNPNRNRRSFVARLLVMCLMLATLAVAFSPVVGAAPKPDSGLSPQIQCQSVTWSTVRSNGFVGGPNDGYISFNVNLQAEYDSVSHVFCNEARSRLDVKYNNACRQFSTYIRDNGIALGAKGLTGCSNSFSFYSYAWYVTDGDVLDAEGGDLDYGGATANWTAP